MALGEFFLGSPGTFQQVPTLSPAQQTLQEQTLQQLSPLLQQLAQPLDSSALLSERIRQFETQTIPALAERFTAGFGSSPYLSSGFRGALGAAGAGLQSQLGALEAQTQLQDVGRRQQLAGLLANLGMAPSFDVAFQPGARGFLGGAAQTLPSLIPTAASFLAPGLGLGTGGLRSMLAQLLGGRSQGVL